MLQKSHIASRITLHPCLYVLNALDACLQAVADAGLEVSAIHSVEAVGSSSRVPAILNILQEFFGKEPGRTLNSKEVVSRGCALNCAMLSPIFRSALSVPFPGADRKSVV